MIYGNVRTLKQLQSITGTLGWYRQFIPNLSTEISNLYDKMKNKQNKITMTDEEYEQLEQIHTNLKNSPRLNLPDLNKPFLLFTDASDIGCGSVLIQEKGIIGYSSYKFNGYQQKWSVTEKEMYSVLKAIDHWRYLIFGCEIRVYTDNKNNTYRTFDFTKKTERWKSYLNQFNITYLHISGKNNFMADYLSRDHIEQEPELLLNNLNIHTTSPIPYDFQQTHLEFHILNGHPGIRNTIETMRMRTNLNPQRRKIIERDIKKLCILSIM